MTLLVWGIEDILPCNFDFNDPMGDSTCVSCGECVQACPTGALMESNLLDEKGKKIVKPDRKVDSFVSLS